MPNKDKWEVTFDMAIKKMFKMVGERYPNKKLTDQKEWYSKREWSDADQNKFMDWMRALLKKRHPRLMKKQIDLEVAMFNLSYGWRCKHEEK